MAASTELVLRGYCALQLAFGNEAANAQLSALRGELCQHQPGPDWSSASARKISIAGASSLVDVCTSGSFVSAKAVAVCVVETGLHQSSPALYPVPVGTRLVWPP